MECQTGAEYAFSFSTWEAEVGGSLSSRPAALQRELQDRHDCIEKPFLEKWNKTKSLEKNATFKSYQVCLLFRPIAHLIQGDYRIKWLSKIKSHKKIIMSTFEPSFN